MKGLATFRVKGSENESGGRVVLLRHALELRVSRV